MSKKAKELRELSEKELVAEREKLQDRIRNFRFKSRIEAPKNPMEKREMKRQIARINTLLTERANAEEVSNG